MKQNIKNYSAMIRQSNRRQQQQQNTDNTINVYQK